MLVFCEGNSRPARIARADLRRCGHFRRHRCRSLAGRRPNLDV